MKNKKRILSKLGVVTLSATMLAGGILPSIGHAQIVSIADSQINNVLESEITPNQEAIDFVNDMTAKGVFNEFTYDLKGYLVLKHTSEYLQKVYRLSDKEMDNLNQIINVSAMGRDARFNLNLIQERLSFSSGSTWVQMNLTYSDTAGSIFAIGATVGPAAVEAALIAWAFLGGGAIGGVAATVVTLLSGASLLSIVNTGVNAIKQKKGMYIKLGIDGFLPYLHHGVK
jgi:hypothetical protein